jgi:ATP-dependent DNA ligase
MLRPPVEPMLAATVRDLPPPGACPGGCAYEPKWDGWRALLFHDGDRVFLQSRTGRPLAPYFPEITRIARAALPAHVVLDGELLVWEHDHGRTSFAMLQRRVSGGTQAVRLARAHPAHFVSFDLLQTPDGRPILDQPLRRRRAHLEALLTGAPETFPLTPQTTDVDTAREWFDTWPAVGVEGLVVKGLDEPYRPGRRGWRKLRHRHSAEVIVGGVTGTLAGPESVLVGRFDATGRLRFGGRTGELTPRQRRDLAPLLSPPGRRRDGQADHPWPRPLPTSWLGHPGSRPTEYQQVDLTVVVEVDVDAAYEFHRWRHRPGYLRTRPDLSIYEVPLAEATPDER